MWSSCRKVIVGKLSVWLYFLCSLAVMLILSSFGVSPSAFSVYGWIAGAASFVILERRLSRITSVLTALAAFLLASGVLAIYLAEFPDLQWLAILACVATGTVVLEIGCQMATQGRALWFWIGLAFVLRLLFSGSLNLLSQEAYYWKYAENLSPGYLDHPPAVGFLIWLSTACFGNSEWAARFPALLCWLGSAYYVWRLTARIAGREAALWSMMLLSFLPYFAASGFFMSPEAPLLLAWSALLFLLYRALVDGRGSLWLQIGIWLGVGLLSKYSIVLIGVAAFVFVLSDAKSRVWLGRPQPYLASLVALMIFSPVLWWNFNHDWASFVFQGPRRLEEKTGFYLHTYLLHLLIILTPVGMIEWARCRLKEDLQGESTEWERGWLYCVVMSLVPVVVFMLFSLNGQPKINWAGPAFLALLPLLGSQAVRRCETIGRAWIVTFAMVGIFAGIAAVYLSLGIPGVPYSEKLRKFLGWPELARQIMQLEAAVRRETGETPVVVGMDSHYVGSQLGFYRARLGLKDAAPTSGRHLFGGTSLMYSYWSSPDVFRGKSLILVSRTKSDLADSVIGPYVKDSEPIVELEVYKSGFRVGHYYVRVVYDYIGPSFG